MTLKKAERRANDPGRVGRLASGVLYQGGFRIHNSDAVTNVPLQRLTG